MPKKQKTPPVEKSSRVVTECYSWGVTIHPQASIDGTPLRYLQFTASDGEVSFRAMNIAPELAQTIAKMLTE